MGMQRSPSSPDILEEQQKRLVLLDIKTYCLNCYVYNNISIRISKLEEYAIIGGLGPIHKSADTRCMPKTAGTLVTNSTFVPQVQVTWDLIFHSDFIPQSIPKVASSDWIQHMFILETSCVLSNCRVIKPCR